MPQNNRVSNRVSFNANPLLASGRSQMSRVSMISGAIDEEDSDMASNPSMELPKGTIKFST